MSMVVNQSYVKRHTMSFVVAHWINAISFFVLFITGLPLLSPSFHFLYEIFGDANFQIIHRVFAVIFIVNPIIGIFLARKGYWIMMSEPFKFGKRDMDFLMKFPMDLLGMHPKVEKQTYYNGGEKINIALQILFWGVLVVSGAIMWLGAGIIDNSTRTWFISIHAIAASLGMAMAFGHIYLAAGVNPDSVHGMVDGTIKAKYAEHHHGKWIEDCIRNGEVTEQEMEEAIQKY